MTRQRSLVGQYLSPGPGASSSARPKEGRGGTGALLHLSLPRFAAPLLYQLSKLWRLDLFALLPLKPKVPAEVDMLSRYCAHSRIETHPAPGAHAGVNERRSRRLKMVGDDKARLVGRQGVCRRRELHLLLSTQNNNNNNDL